MQVSDAKRLRALEEENRRLKRIVADQALNLQALKDVLGKSGDGPTAAGGRYLCLRSRRAHPAPCLPLFERAPIAVSLPIPPTAGHSCARKVARAGRDAAALEWSASHVAAASRRHAQQSQASRADLPGRRSERETQRSQAAGCCSENGKRVS